MVSSPVSRLAPWRFPLGGSLAVLVLSGLCLLSEAASAARVVWKRTKLDEVSNSWKINVDLYLDRAPDVPHVPFRFTFTQTSSFERSLVDGKKDPVMREQPLEHQQPIIESVDVGFLDPGSGKTVSRTRFSFEITRDRGFQAGRYEVKVADARNSKDLGGSTSLTLDGDNEVVDRRSMVFDAKKEAKPAKSGAPAAEEKKELSPEDDAFWAGGPKQPEEKRPALPPPASMQQKPGCGCRIGERSSDGAALSLVFVLGASIALRRSRRRAA